MQDHKNGCLSPKGVAGKELFQLIRVHCILRISCIRSTLFGGGWVTELWLRLLSGGGE